MSKPPPPQQGSFTTAKLYMWVKGLESKVNNLTRELDSFKNDFMKKHNTLLTDVKMVNQDLLELKRNEEKTHQKMDLIIKELKKTDGAEEVITLKKYVEFWNPLNFVTQRDLDRALEAKHIQKNHTQKGDHK